MSKAEAKSGNIPAQIIVALERLGRANIRTLAKETRHWYQTVLNHLEQLRQAGRIIATIPEDVLAGRISPGRVIWLLLPPDEIGIEQHGDGRMPHEGEWEPYTYRTNSPDEIRNPSKMGSASGGRTSAPC